MLGADCKLLLCPDLRIISLEANRSYGFMLCSNRLKYDALIVSIATPDIDAFLAHQHGNFTRLSYVIHANNQSVG